MSENCPFSHFWQICDSFLPFKLTVFRHIYKIWYSFDTFPILIWHTSDRVLILTDFWQIYDTFQTVIWHIFATDSFLTVYRQISDRFLKLTGPTRGKSTKEGTPLLQCKAAQVNLTIEGNTVLQHQFSVPANGRLTRPLCPDPVSTSSYFHSLTNIVSWHAYMERTGLGVRTLITCGSESLVPESALSNSVTRCWAGRQEGNLTSNLRIRHA